jgi:hypothetical protein
MSYNHSDVIHTLWDELADFDASRSDEALIHLMNSLCALAEAQNITWMGSVRLDESFPNDPAKGWRPGVVSFLHSALPLDAAVREQTEKLELGNVDENIIRNLDGAGSFRANRLRDLVGPEWFESFYYQTYFRGVGHEDAVWVAFPVNKDVESWFGIFRGPNQPPFTES